MAPTYPECDESDLRLTLKEIAALDPITVFHEPINIRAENVGRIQRTADTLGIKLRTDVFETPTKWRKYATTALKTVEEISRDLGLADRLHLWPDKALGSKAALGEIHDPKAHTDWLSYYWSRVSEWPRFRV
jgi:hypothetical protein